MANKKEDAELEILLQFDGTVTIDPSGFWWKIEARMVAITAGRPRGVKYSLTLHDPCGKRVYGIDNAHSVGGKKNSSIAVEYDHSHPNGRKHTRVEYQFESAAKLLKDFFAEVDARIGAAALKERSAKTL